VPERPASASESERRSSEAAAADAPEPEGLCGAAAMAGAEQRALRGLAGAEGGARGWHGAQRCQCGVRRCGCGGEDKREEVRRSSDTGSPCPLREGAQLAPRGARQPHQAPLPSPTRTADTRQPRRDAGERHGVLWPCVLCLGMPLGCSRCPRTTSLDARHARGAQSAAMLCRADASRQGQSKACRRRGPCSVPTLISR
jgi:hypothetical protein